MSRTVNDEDLYSRGRYRLVRDRKKDGTLRTPYFQVEWYDPAARRNKSRSTRTTDQSEAECFLDALYLERERGMAVCYACGQPIQAGQNYMLADSIADYLLARAGKPSIKSIESRLDHVLNYLEETGREDTTCEQVDEDWIDAFREWAIEVPIISKLGARRDRAPGTVEASVRQLAAAINYSHKRKDTLHPAAFSAKPPEEVSHSPSYRADIRTLAAMFRYCTEPEGERMTEKQVARKVRERANLLRFLQISVATWARPDAALDFSLHPKKQQWDQRHGVIALNPRGRVQTRKYRATVPAARQIVPLLENATGYFVDAASVARAMNTMLDHLGLPRDGETGMKLIRRSMASLARDRLGERDWIEGQIMLGHRPQSKSSDVYAPYQAGYLARAKAVTEEIIADIESLCPKAFHRSNTGDV